MMVKFLVLGVFVIFCLVRVEMTLDKEVETFRQYDLPNDAISRFQEKALERNKKREIQNSYVCADENQYCPAWAATGECNNPKYSGYMKVYCKTSCGLCEETCTSGTTENGECCVFPFIYKKKSYDMCTTVDNDYTLWCSTTDNYDLDSKRGNCNPADYDGSYKSGVERYDENGRRCVTTGTWSKTEKCYRQRKEFTSMTYDERVRYIQVIKKAASHADYKPRYDALISIHKKLFSTTIHLSTDFLPWHRWYILQYENLLREVDPKFTVSYWDWSLVAEDPYSSDLWKDGPDGFGGGGVDCIPRNSDEGVGNGRYSRFSPLQADVVRKPECPDNHGAPLYNSNCVTTGPFRYGEFNLIPLAGGGCLTRKFISGTTAPNAVAVQLLIKDHPAAEFVQFERELRIEMHDLVHCVIGGVMCDEQAATAPEFFLHHSFVDKIWDDYQKQSFEHHAPHHLTSQQGKMEASQYETSDFLDLENMPGCVAVEYLPPKNAVYRLLEPLNAEHLKNIPSVRLPDLSQAAKDVFDITRPKLERLKSAETFFKSNNIIPTSELNGVLAKLLGFNVEDLQKQADRTLADAEEDIKREDIMRANGQYFK